METLLQECSDFMLTHELMELLNNAFGKDETINEDEAIDETINEEEAIDETINEDEAIDESKDEEAIDEGTPDVSPPKEEEETKPKKSIFYPDLQDSLFWCMYVNERGISAFETQRILKKNMVNIMMTEKRNMFDYFNKEKQPILKQTNHKITNATANEIKCDIMTHSLSSFQNLIACSVYWKCPIMVELDKNIYVKFVSNAYQTDNQEEEDAETVLLYVVKARKTPEKGMYRKELTKYKFALETDKDKRNLWLQNMRKSGFCIEHYQKPLRGISNYSVDDLLDIHKIVCEGATPEKLKKQELYQNIIVKLGTMTVKQFI